MTCYLKPLIPCNMSRKSINTRSWDNKPLQCAPVVLVGISNEYSSIYVLPVFFFVNVINTVALAIPIFELLTYGGCPGKSVKFSVPAIFARNLLNHRMFVQISEDPDVSSENTSTWNRVWQIETSEHKTCPYTSPLHNMKCFISLWKKQIIRFWLTATFLWMQIHSQATLF